MKIFGQLVRTAVNVATLPITIPIAIVKDVTSAGTDEAIKKLVEKIKSEADE